MKKLILLVGFISLLQSCIKEEDTPVVRGKLVYRSCASIVVQVLDSAHFNLGQTTWQPPDVTKAPYRHVFTVANHCDFPNLKEGDEFSFKLSKTIGNSCVICTLFDNPPQKKQTIQVINK